MAETILKIDGMTCHHCKQAVEKALKGVPGVIAVNVDLAAKQAVVAGSAALSAMVDAVKDAGYEAIA